MIFLLKLNYKRILKVKLNIKKLREKSGLKQYEVADLLNLSPANYGKIENERVALTFEMAIKLTKIFNCSLNDIAGIENDLAIQGYEKVESEDIEFILFMKEKHKK